MRKPLPLHTTAARCVAHALQAFMHSPAHLTLRCLTQPHCNITLWSHKGLPSWDHHRLCLWKTTEAATHTSLMLAHASWTAVHSMRQDGRGGGDRCGDASSALCSTALQLRPVLLLLLLL
eukprot:CAMPEP_0202364468 /NCGR_PEP_ID=MMETSP1126-20121109/15865_2 /ASSEMBLY_ACC=CAM_ASM_000457 /TAXON_ID=3047 /ORGANISM="Dunaliella tertiolecta, Strain CCMP1320" /LENGTH=119 /DNA_ID=CAMNT_0048959119 /DNA_START=30 /DNA_END=385 /DNA_ORIENTATION=-